MRAPMNRHDVRSAALGCGVSAAAAGAVAAARRRGRRRSLRREVATVMTTDVATIRPAASLVEAAERLADAEAGALPVCDGDDRLVGVISDRDIVVRALAQGDDPAQACVGDCVTPEPATVAPMAPLEDALELMSEHAVRRLPVVRNGRVVGMLSEHDLALNAPPSRVGSLMGRLAAAPSDRTSAAVLFRRPHGPRREAGSDAARGGEMDRAVEALRAMR